MTKEELTNHLKLCAKYCVVPSVEALDEAIKALETVDEFEKAQIITGGRLNGRAYAYKCGLEDGKRKALEQPTSDDCVSRQAVTDTVENTISKYIPTFIGQYEKIPLELARAIKDVPPVTPTRKVGKWIYDRGSYICPFCKHKITGLEKDLNYCCKCGAEMRGSENE